jgi:hypothetical protein
MVSCDYFPEGVPRLFIVHCVKIAGDNNLALELASCASPRQGHSYQD